MEIYLYLSQKWKARSGALSSWMIQLLSDAGILAKQEKGEGYGDEGCTCAG